MFDVKKQYQFRRISQFTKGQGERISHLDVGRKHTRISHSIMGKGERISHSDVKRCRKILHLVEEEGE